MENAGEVQIPPTLDGLCKIIDEAIGPWIKAVGDQDFGLSGIAFKLGYQSGKRIKQREVDARAGYKKSDMMDCKLLDKKIQKVLEELGFSPKHAGTRYINEVLLLALTKPALECGKMEALYIPIAKKYYVCKGAVSKGIRCAIEKAWIKGDCEEIERLYPFGWSDETGRPTNKEFIRNIMKLLK